MRTVSYPKVEKVVRVPQNPAPAAADEDRQAQGLAVKSHDRSFR
jgi:hypothetical protein